MEPREHLERELSDGETLLWSGRPRQGLFLRASDFFMIPVSLLWGGFAFVWEGVVVYHMFIATKHADQTPLAIKFIFPIFGGAFCLIGLYLIVGRFFADRALRARTFYGVTNERVIILSGLFQRSVKSLPLQLVADLSLVERSDGAGTITLGHAPPFGMLMTGMDWWPGVKKFSPPALDLIPDAAQVYQLIRKAAREQARSR